MTIQNGTIRRGTLALWVVANALNSALCTAVVSYIRSGHVDASRFAAEGSRAYIVAAYCIVAAYHGIAPLLTGLTQWLLLRRLFAHAGWWVLATTLGFGLGVAAINPVFAFVSFRVAGEESDWGIIAASIVCGLVPGIAQWLVLRRWVRRSLWWVLASTIGMSAAILLFIKMTNGTGVGLGHSGANGLLSGAVYGGVTGATLVLLIHLASIGRRGFEVVVAGE